MYLSIVIPAYNEEGRIGTSLTEIYSFLKKRNYDFEIIVVDDGSKDKTLNLLSEYSQNIPNLIVLKNESNQGKGFSVKKGVLNSKGDIILYTDADLSTPIGELDKLIYWLDEGYPISIGSRDLPESQVNRHQAWYRELMGKIFNRIIRLILNLDYHDTQCGFKCFRNDAALEIFKGLRLCGFSFDVEMLFIAKHRGIKVKEVPIRWHNSPESKVKIVRDSSKMLWDILKLRFNNFKD
jgi:dolichyl-phosphate beta-glucosyltransferase